MAIDLRVHEFSLNMCVCCAPPNTHAPDAMPAPTTRALCCKSIFFVYIAKRANRSAAVERDVKWNKLLGQFVFLFIFYVGKCCICARRRSRTHRGHI